jgi:hypothetical protein
MTRMTRTNASKGMRCMLLLTSCFYMNTTYRYELAAVRRIEVLIVKQTMF